MLRDVVIDIIDIDFSNPFERSCYSILILRKGDYKLHFFFSCYNR